MAEPNPKATNKEKSGSKTSTKTESDPGLNLSDRLRQRAIENMERENAVKKELDEKKQSLVGKAKPRFKLKRS